MENSDGNIQICSALSKQKSSIRWKILMEIFRYALHYTNKNRQYLPIEKHGLIHKVH